MNTCLAIDIGGTKIAVALIESGQILKLDQRETPSSNYSEDMTLALKELLAPFKEQADFIAVASTGIINQGVLTALNPDNLGGLNQYRLADTLEQICQKPVMVINDAQAAAWAEYKTLESTFNAMGFITVSTGVGAGFVINDSLLIGQYGIAGHAGHILADPNGPTCGCGRKGCVESIASGTAIGKAGQAFFGSDCTGKIVFDQYQKGHPEAIAIVENAAKTIANLIADLKITLDLQVVCLGGSIGLAPGFLPRVHHHLSLLPSAHQVKVMHAHSGANAGLLGVASWAQNIYNNKALPR
ncbi:N-acetylmannosamine kinase [Vibrio kanaloae]|uniref:N-acetylmannosamine kinase n=1 Tax=Vibrio kanaloae TaxID=170673 RepID=UPI0012440E4F|nr:N-acetylmannosamine kinase [Vibrio kanaloae]KAB0462977.1 ROK family protein [Vibrio kanaloae]